MPTKALTRTVYRTVKAKRRHRAKFTLPLAVVAGFIPLGLHIKHGYDVAGIHGAGHNMVEALTGYNEASHDWDFKNLKYGTGPIVAGFMVHYFASKFGINRALGRAKVPFLRI